MWWNKVRENYLVLGIDLRASENTDTTAGFCSRIGIILSSPSSFHVSSVSSSATYSPDATLMPALRAAVPLADVDRLHESGRQSSPALHAYCQSSHH